MSEFRLTKIQTTDTEIRTEGNSDFRILFGHLNLIINKFKKQPGPASTVDKYSLRNISSAGDRGSILAVGFYLFSRELIRKYG